MSQSRVSIKETGYDNWDGGTTIFGLYCSVPIELYHIIDKEIQIIESNIKNKIETLIRAYPNSWVGDVVISPELTEDIQGKAYNISHGRLVTLLEKQQRTVLA